MIDLKFAARFFNVLMFSQNEDAGSLIDQKMNFSDILIFTVMSLGLLTALYDLAAFI